MNKPNKFLTFMKKNALYFILTACILAVGLSVTLMLIAQDQQNNVQVEVPVIETPLPDETNKPSSTPDDNEVVEPVQKPITFIMPVNNTTSILEYSEELTWCSTLSRFEVHKAMDFFAEEGSSVYAVYDGVIESVTSTFLQGVSITIDHGNGLKTVYNSLADGDQVFVGQIVSQGDIIGEVSQTNRQEYKDGAHLHFEVLENNISIDPIKYLSINEK
jgi:murein DD-endopeptidase MepM/ murein hydrolase activator NlpD